MEEIDGVKIPTSKDEFDAEFESDRGRAESLLDEIKFLQNLLGDDICENSHKNARLSDFLDIISQKKTPDSDFARGFLAGVRVMELLLFK